MDLQIINGDCMVELKKIPNGSVKAVVTDPPYGIDYQSAWRIDPAARKEKIANDERPFIWFLLDAFRILADGGAILCFCRWDVQEAFRMAIEAAGFTIQSQVVWDRQAHGMGDLNASFAPQHDVIWFGTKGAFKFPGERPKSVISAMRLGGEALVHPNEKPIKLMRDLVSAVAAPGDTVVDPFLGSGSTGVAARQLGCNFIGIEMNPKYADLARDRIIETTPMLRQEALL